MRAPSMPMESDTIAYACPGHDRITTRSRFNYQRGNSVRHATPLGRQMQSDRPSAAESDVATGAAHGDAPASEEWILLQAVLKKDRKATAEFVSRYADPVYGYVSQRLAPRADLVEDLVQEVFLVALEKLDTFAGKSSVVG